MEGAASSCSCEAGELSNTQRLCWPRPLANLGCGQHRVLGDLNQSVKVSAPPLPLHLFLPQGFFFPPLPSFRPPLLLLSEPLSFFLPWRRSRDFSEFLFTTTLTYVGAIYWSPSLFFIPEVQPKLTPSFSSWTNKLSFFFQSNERILFPGHTNTQKTWMQMPELRCKDLLPVSL